MKKKYIQWNVFEMSSAQNIGYFVEVLICWLTGAYAVTELGKSGFR